MNLRRFSSDFWLAATAISAMLWAIARAAVQAITIDEADTYLVWVARPTPSHWVAASNNHVLNSLLMRLTTGLFGVSHLSVRAPALVGAALYIAMAWALVVLAAPTLRERWPLLVAMIYNPFVFDHLVAARGYSLALGFLLAAIAVAAWADTRQWPVVQVCGVASACLGLSFAANFSFAIVDGLTMAAVATWACARTQPAWARVRVLGACVPPGLLVTLFVSAPVVLHFPKRELVYGAHSMGEWLGEIARDSIYRLNPQIVNPMLISWLERVKGLLIPVLLILAGWQWLRGRGTRLGYGILGLLLTAVLAHWIAFHTLHLLMPKQRTGIWLVPLITLAAGSVAAKHRAVTASLYAVAFYFLFCLRLGYFREWQWDEDVKKVYDVVAYYNHNYGVREVASYWMYAPSLNFYRAESGHESLNRIEGAIETPPPSLVSVLNWDKHEEVIRERGLKVVYRGEHSDVVVAVRADVEVARCGVN